MYLFYNNNMKVDEKPCQAQSIASQHLLSWEISHPVADEAPALILLSNSRRTEQ